MSRKILIISSNAKSLLLFRYELIEALVQKGLQVYALVPEGQLTLELESLLSAIGLQLSAYAIRNRGLNPFFDFKTIRILYKTIQILKPDIILSYTVKPVIYGAIAARYAKVLSVFSMITGRGSLFIENGFKKTALRFFAKWLYRYALSINKKVFFQNPDDLEFFVKANMVSEQQCVLINGSGINLERFKLCPVENFSHFLFIGRLIPDKGIFEFIEAAKKIKSNYPAAIFTVIGPLQGHAKTKTILDALCEAGISYIQEVFDVRPYIQSCSVFVLPSYAEGTPRSVLEAMAMGRPIITTDAPGCRETVEDGVNGFLVPVKDPCALAGAMLKFIEHPEFIQTMGEKSRELAEKKYDVHKVNEAILSAMKLI